MLKFKVTSIKPLTGLDRLEILLATRQRIRDIRLLPKKVKLSESSITD